MRPTLTSLAVTLALVAGAAAPARAADTPGHITVTGTGEVRAAPDMAMLTIGVVNQGKSASEALAGNSKAMSDAIATLKAAGIAPADLQTSSFSIQPVYANETNRSAPRVISAYQVSNQVSVRVRDLAHLGEILDKAVGIGANQVNGPTFMLSDPESARAKAREAAIADAERRAKLYAQALNVRLGPVRAVSEGTTSFVPRSLSMSPAIMAAPPPPIEAGETTVSANVTVEWDIAP